MTNKLSLFVFVLLFALLAQPAALLAQDTIRLTLDGNTPHSAYIAKGKPVKQQDFKLSSNIHLVIDAKLAPFLVVLRNTDRHTRFNFQFGQGSRNNKAIDATNGSIFTITDGKVSDLPATNPPTLLDTPLVIQIKKVAIGKPLLADTILQKGENEAVVANDDARSRTADAGDGQTIERSNIITKIPIYDAQSIVHRDDTPDSVCVQILLHYFDLTGKSDGSATDTVIGEIKANPYLDGFRDPFIEFLKAQKDSVQPNVFPFVTATGGGLINLGSIGGLDVTTIAQGVAELMIKRAKEELTIAFFDRFKKVVENNPEIKILFPKTTNNLENLLSYKYPDMINVLRKGFIDDLDQLCFQLDDVLELPRYKELLKNFPEIRIAIRSIRLVQELEQKKHPADVLTEFAAFPEWKDAAAGTVLKNFGGAVQTANLFSQSLRSDITTGPDQRAWVKPNYLDSLIKDAPWFQLYMAFVYEMAKKAGICFYKGTTPYPLTKLLESQKDNFFLVQNNLQEFIQLSQKVQQAAQNIKDKTAAKTAPTNDDYYSYINTGIDVIEYAFGIAQHFDADLDISAYVKLARQADDLYRNIYQKQYSQAITNSVTIVKEVVDMVKSNANEKLNTLNTSNPSLQAGITRKVLIFGQTDTSFTHLGKDDLNKINGLVIAASTKNDTARKIVLVAANGNKNLTKLSNVLDLISKYGLFAANMASATTPDQVSSILDNAILPVGSSSIKKNATWNLSVQSYLGAYWMTKKPGNNLNIAWNNRFGVTAPIGLSFSYGIKKGGAFGAFASLFDLGAIVDYDLQRDSLVNPQSDTTISKNYKVKLGQIFSPGFYLVYNIGGNLPLSAGFGWQYGPGLGKINVDGTTSVLSPRWRASIFLAVDIPFFTIINHQRPN